MGKINRRSFIKKTGGTALSTLPIITYPSFFINKKSKTIKLTILHTNDVHSHIDPFPKEHSKFPSMGGASARYNLINNIRRSNENVLLFDSGDIMQGTPYFNYFNGEVEFKIMNEMKYSAATIGNHDFDGGMEVLLKNIKNANFPFVISNYNFDETILHDSVLKYKVFKINKLRIGVFGVGIKLEGLVDKKLYDQTIYTDPVIAANKTAAILKNKKKCDYVICLSHLGFTYKNPTISDIRLSKQTENIDLIIGGHTHTFLKEPYIVKNTENKNVLITQAGWAGVKLGRLDLFFDKKKKLENTSFKDIKIKN